MPTLIYEKTQTPVAVGDIVHLRGRPCVVTGWAEPHKPSSTGRVHIQTMCDRGIFSAQYFPVVIGANWIGRTDRGA